MEQDIIINSINRNGITVDLVDNCKIFVPICAIIKVKGQYARCTRSYAPDRDCARCLGTYRLGHTLGLCSALMCRKFEREDDTNVFFEVIDTDKRIRKEGNR